MSKHENKYGDALIWFQLLDKKFWRKKKDIIFVINDSKDDWTEDNGKGKRVARRELVQEMREEAGSKFVVYTLAQFIQAARDFLKEAPNVEAVKGSEGS